MTKQDAEKRNMEQQARKQDYEEEQRKLKARMLNEKGVSQAEKSLLFLASNRPAINVCIITKLEVKENGLP